MTIKLDVKFEDLLGKTLVKCYESDNAIIFVDDKNHTYKLYHEQDCCESVYIEDINGKLEDLVGSPILLAEEVGNYDIPPLDNDDYYTWTFYRLGTQKGFVDIRWYGYSNGYYSESVDFGEVL